jgi:hypothetical protein
MNHAKSEVRPDDQTIPVYPEIPVFAETGAKLDSIETPYLSEPNSAQISERWQGIQASFVDDPRRAVAEANQLVGDLMQRIVDSFAHERSALEGQWQSGEKVSTEDLRICLQRYRAFFTRLLPAVPTSG